MFFDLNDTKLITSASSLCHTMGSTIGITSGCFDLFHYYHLKTLQRCKSHCNFLIVGVDSDKLVQDVKGPTRPVFEEKHRLALVEGASPVDAVFLMNEVDDFARMIELAGVHNIFKNQDFCNKDDLVIAGVDKIKGSVLFVDDIEPETDGEITSTTDFIKKIKKTC